MALKWPVKDPDETLDYSVDWSRFLGDNTITAIVWYIEDSDGTRTEVSPVQTVNTLTAEAESFTNTVSTIQLSGGTAGVTYKVVSQITYGPYSLVAIRTVQLPVREK